MLNVPPVQVLKKLSKKPSNIKKPCLPFENQDNPDKKNHFRIQYVSRLFSLNTSGASLGIVQESN